MSRLFSASQIKRMHMDSFEKIMRTYIVIFFIIIIFFLDYIQGESYKRKLKKQHEVLTVIKIKDEIITKTAGRSMGDAVYN